MRTRPFTFVSKTVRSSSSVDVGERLAPECEAGRVHEDVRGAGGVDEALAARGVGDVERERDVRLEPLDAAGAADDPRALVREHARRRGADPARGARDDRGRAVEPTHGRARYPRTGCTAGSAT